MKFQENFVGTKTDFAAFIKKSIPELFANRLAVEGKTVKIPTDSELSYKVKVDEDEVGGSVTIKVAWENDQVEVEDVDTED